MKKILFALFTFLSTLSYSQVKIGPEGAVIPTGDYPVIFSKDVKGSLHSVQTLSDRNNIPDTHRERGMLVFVRDSSAYYYLYPNLTNLDWNKLQFGPTQIDLDSAIVKVQQVSDTTLRFFFKNNSRPFQDISIKVYTDTTQLSNRINSKVNISDTAGRWVWHMFKRGGTDSIFYSVGNNDIFAFKDSSWNQPLLSRYSVPFVGSDGKFTQDNSNFYYNGSLMVGNGDFYSESGINLNGGRGKITASGFGLQIGTTGGGVNGADASKHMRFKNSSREYLHMFLPTSGPPQTTPLEGEVSMYWYPSITDSFDLGKSNKRWKNGYFKNIYINGNLFDPNLSGTYIPLSQKAQPDGVATLDNSGKVPLAQLPQFSVSPPTYIQTKVEMLASSVGVGGIVLLGDSSKFYTLLNNPATDFNNWLELKTAIIESTDALPEGLSNPYYSDSRARNALSGTGRIQYNNVTGVIDVTSPDWDVPGDILNQPVIPPEFTPIEGTNISITGTYPSLTFDTRNIYDITQTDSIALKLRSEIQVAANGGVTLFQVDSAVTHQVSDTAISIRNLILDSTVQAGNGLNKIGNTISLGDTLYSGIRVKMPSYEPYTFITGDREVGFINGYLAFGERGNILGNTTILTSEESLTGGNILKFPKDTSGTIATSIKFDGIKYYPDTTGAINMGMFNINGLATKQALYDTAQAIRNAIGKGDVMYSQLDSALNKVRFDIHDSTFIKRQELLDSLNNIVITTPTLQQITDVDSVTSHGIVSSYGFLAMGNDDQAVGVLNVPTHSSVMIAAKSDKPARIVYTKQLTDLLELGFDSIKNQKYLQFPNTSGVLAGSITNGNDTIKPTGDGVLNITSILSNMGGGDVMYSQLDSAITKFREDINDSAFVKRQELLDSLNAIILPDVSGKLNKSDSTLYTSVTRLKDTAQAIRQSIPDVSDVVLKSGTQTISGTKTFTANKTLFNSIVGYPIIGVGTAGNPYVNQFLDVSSGKGGFGFNLWYNNLTSQYEYINTGVWSSRGAILEVHPTTGVKFIKATNGVNPAIINTYFSVDTSGNMIASTAKFTGLTNPGSGLLFARLGPDGTIYKRTQSETISDLGAVQVGGLTDSLQKVRDSITQLKLLIAQLQDSVSKEDTIWTKPGLNIEFDPNTNKQTIFADTVSTTKDGILLANYKTGSGDTLATRSYARSLSGGGGDMNKSDSSLYVTVTRLKDSSIAFRNAIPDISGKVNISDTNSMLSKYLRKTDTTGKWKPANYTPSWGDITGKPNIPSTRINIINSTSNKTLALSDTLGLITQNSSSATTITIPTNASVAIPVGMQITVARYGIGTVTVAASGGVTLISADDKTGLRAKGSTATLIKTDTNTWLLVGDIN